MIDTENKVRLQHLHKTKTSTSAAKVASISPNFLPDLTCEDDRFATLEAEYNTKEEMCMGVNLPAHFPPRVLVMCWIQRIETFGPIVAYKWACTHKAELQVLETNAVHSILLSSHGPEKRLLQILLEEIGRLRRNTCVTVVNKSCGCDDWVGELQKLAAHTRVDMGTVQIVSIDLVDFDGRHSVLELHPDKQYFPNGGQADVMGSSLVMMRCPGEFAAG